MKYFWLLVVIFLYLIAGCKKKSNTADLTGSLQSDSLTVETLPLPVIPESLTSPEERVRYLILHFWDEMDFKDTVRSYNEDFLAQNFVNYISLFPYVEPTTQKEGADHIRALASIDTMAYKKLMDVIDRYLYDIESPMLSEELYIPFLESRIQHPFPNEIDKDLAETLMEEVMKNRVGTIAANFNFVTREGLTTSLHDTKGSDELLLIFYDPTCEVCHDLIQRLSTDDEINRRIETGVLSVLAIYSGEDKASWEKQNKKMPLNWIVGYEKGEIDREDLYILRASPTVYLLDGVSKEVLVKDLRL